MIGPMEAPADQWKLSSRKQMFWLCVEITLTAQGKRKVNAAKV